MMVSHLVKQNMVFSLNRVSFQWHFILYHIFYSALMEAQDVFGIDFDPSEFGFGSDEEDDPEHGGENVLIFIG